MPTCSAATTPARITSRTGPTAFTVIGLPPDWYKDLEYRSRVVRDSRTVLREMGLALADDVEIRVWDTTTDTRYMVLPEQPPHTIGWPEEKLAEVVSRDALIGVARLLGAATWTVSTTSAVGKVSAECAIRSTLPHSTRAGR